MTGTLWNQSSLGPVSARRVKMDLCDAVLWDLSNRGLRASGANLIIASTPFILFWVRVAINSVISLQCQVSCCTGRQKEKRTQFGEWQRRLQNKGKTCSWRCFHTKQRSDEYVGHMLECLEVTRSQPLRYTAASTSASTHQMKEYPAQFQIESPPRCIGGPTPAQERCVVLCGIFPWFMESG